MEAWITRDESPIRDDYAVWSRKPVRKVAGCWVRPAGDNGGSIVIAEFCPKTFHKLTGIRLRKGQIKTCTIQKLKSGVSLRVP